MPHDLSVLHVVGTLDFGGAERTAVNLANAWARAQGRSLLCATRRSGPLAPDLRHDVRLISLQRRHRFDLAALARLRRVVVDDCIEIVHAHGPAVFAALAATTGTRAAVVWHLHSGAYAKRRARFVERRAARRVHAVATVNAELAEWARRELGHESASVLAAFVEQRQVAPADVPGVAGQRVVCVANLRPVKGHATLLEAFVGVAAEHPNAHLLLVGAEPDRRHAAKLRALVQEGDLESRVTFLGARRDVEEVLTACDVAVLSSLSEGLPVALLEYAARSLPIVCTHVGACADFLEHGAAGILVPPGDPGSLARALGRLLQSSDDRRRLGEAAHRVLCHRYDAHAGIERVTEIYRAARARAG